MAAGAALVVGASGGIGAALAEHWQQSGSYSRVLAASRQPALLPPPWAAAALHCDYTQPDSLPRLAEAVREQLQGDVLGTVCVCTGILHGPGARPERRLAALQPEAYLQLMQINALGPLLLLNALLPLLPRQGLSRVCVLSARVGSIEDNRLGGWYSYRCSKAALNQGLRSLAVEMGRTHPDCVLTAYHPGTVDTALSRPFQSGVDPALLKSPAEAAACLDAVLQARTHPGELFVDWAGKTIPF